MGRWGKAVWPQPRLCGRVCRCACEAAMGGLPCGNGRGMAGWHQARAELRQMDAQDSSLCARGKGRNVAALAAAYRIKQARNRVRNRARIRIHAARCAHEREWGQAAISAAGTANKWWRGGVRPRPYLHGCKHLHSAGSGRVPPYPLQSLRKEMAKKQKTKGKKQCFAVPAPQPARVPT